MKRLVILSAIVGLLATMLAPSWAGSNLNSSRSNIYRDLCKDKPDGTVVQVEGKRCAAALSKRLGLSCPRRLRSRGAFFAPTALRSGGIAGPQWLYAAR